MLVAVAVTTLTVPAGAGSGSHQSMTPPSGSPGDITGVERMTAYELPLVPMQAKSWRISYRSTTATGEPIAVSGTVLVPKKPWAATGPRPLLGYAIGTQGLADRCAPSKQLADGSEYEAPVIAQALRRGFAIALTDYQGLGTPGKHPYVVGQALGRNVLDSMRAALRLPEAGIDPDAPLGVFGYSEGGGAAGWALQMQPTYAPDLPLKGGAVGAAVANFEKQIDFLEHKVGKFVYFLMLYAAMGFDTAYPELELDSYLNDRGRRATATLQGTCIQDAILGGLLMPRTMSAYTTRNPLETQPLWKQRLAENNLGTIAPQPPVILGRARQDEAIDPSLTLTLYHDWCALGVNAHFVDIPLGEHLTGAFLFAPKAFGFLADRLAGKPATPGCLNP